MLGATREQIAAAHARAKALAVLGLEEEQLTEWEGVYDANWSALLGAVPGRSHSR